MNAFERFFHGPYGASRAYLLGTLICVLTAFDCWTLMIGRAARYGVAGFNVAQFGWLDAVQPVPSAAFYVGVLVGTGLAALVAALVPTNRVLLAAVCALYTCSWSMSMLDSYQHHVFLSWVLLCVVFFPADTARAVHPRGPGERRAGWIYVVAAWVAVGTWFLATSGTAWTPLLVLVAFLGVGTVARGPVAGGAPSRSQGFGYPLLAATIAVLYLYTAIAKMDGHWIGGHTLRTMPEPDTVFARTAALGTAVGLSADTVWAVMATTVIPLEIALAGVYLVAVVQDRLTGRRVRIAALVCFLVAMAFHQGLEDMALRIGWFSAYMMALATAFLLPLGAVDTLTTALTWPARALQDRLAALEEAAGRGMLSLLLTPAAAALLVGVGWQIEVPGAPAACGVAAAVLAVWVLALALRGAPGGPRVALATGFAAIALWAGITGSEVRWDYYRYLAGDLELRGQPEAALDALLMAERFAPEGQTRQARIEELRQRLGR